MMADLLEQLSDVKARQKEVERKKAIAEARADSLRAKEIQLLEQLTALGVQTPSQAREKAADLEKTASQRLASIAEKLSDVL